MQMKHPNRTYSGLTTTVAGAIKLMPGTGSNPNFRQIGVDVETGKVKSLF